jgi:flagellar biogenesis protein FliO
MKKLLRTQFTLTAFLFLANSSCFAVENVDKITSEAILADRTPLISIGYLMQVFFSLLIVAAFLYLTAKYILPKLQVSASKGRMIDVIDRIGLEPQVTAYILRVTKRSWLIVSSSKNVQVVSELEESDQVDNP